MKYFLGCLVTLLSVELARASSLNILDQNDEPISSITEQVCRHTFGTGKQISKLSTIIHIADYLSSLPADHKLATCSNLYLKSATDLVELVSLSNHNCCSREKINAIQQFHRNYILNGSQRTRKTPKILAIFFMHYVNYITRVCAQETVAFLSGIESSTETSTTEVDKLLAELSGKTGVSSASTLQYSEMFLLWSLVDLLPSRAQHKIAKYLFNGDKRVVMATKNFEGFLKMQEFCRKNLQPLYSHSLLSTLKLIDMGYYPSDTSILDKLNSNKQARRLYELTKICEALLPVQVVEQPNQTNSDAVLLSREEVDESIFSESKLEAEAVEFECKRCSIVGLDVLETVTSRNAVPLARSVRGHIKSRKTALSRLLRILTKNTKAHLSDKLRKLFSSEEIENLNENQLDIYEVSEEFEVHESDTNLQRTKRGLSNVIESIASVIGFVIGFLLYAIWSLVTFFVLTPLGLLYFLFAWFVGSNWYEPGWFLITGFGAFSHRRNGISHE